MVSDLIWNDMEGMTVPLSALGPPIRWGRVGGRKRSRQSFGVPAAHHTAQGLKAMQIYDSKQQGSSDFHPGTPEQLTLHA